jgi:hypothetical protein
LMKVRFVLRFQAQDKVQFATFPLGKRGYRLTFRLDSRTLF